MEGSVDGSIPGEMKPVEELVIAGEHKPAENVVSSDQAEESGPDEQKGIDDEVFEEAIGTQELLQEQGEKPELGDGIDTPVNTGSGEVHDDSSAEHESEAFEEAIEVPSLVENHEDLPPVVDEVQAEGLIAAEISDGAVVSDKIDEGGTEYGTGTGEASDAAGEADLLRDAEEGDVKSETETQKPGIGDSEKANLEGNFADGDLEMGDVPELKEVVHGSDQATEPECGKSEKEEDSSVSEIQERGAGIDASVDTPNKPKYDDKNEPLFEVPTFQETVHLKDDTGDANLSHGPDEGEQVHNGMSAVNSEDADDMNGETKETLASSYLGHNGKSDEHGPLADLPTSVKGISVPESSDISKVERNGNTDDIKPDSGVELDFGSHPQKTSKKELVSKIEDSNGVGADLERKAENGQVVELDIVSQPQLADENLVSKPQDNNGVAEVAQDCHGVVEGAERKNKKDPDVIPQPSSSSATSEESEKVDKRQEEKQSDYLNREQFAPLPSSAAKFASHATPSARPASLDKGQEEKQRENLNREREIPFSPLPSSAKSTSHAIPARPAGLGRAAPLFEPAPRAVQPSRVNGTVSQAQTQQIEDPANGEAEENDETREKLQMIRVKFLRLANRLGQTPHNVVVAQVLYRLGLAEQLRGRNGGRVGAFSFDRASAMAVQLEAAGNEPLDFSCTIMVLGKTGVGKSATINSIFDEVKFNTDAFQTGTKKVQDVVGTVHGIKVRVIDTPGLLPSWSDQRQNENILHSVKRFIKKTPPDIVLYLDRLDMQSRDFGDMPLLRTISEIFGPSIWFNAIVVLTHAASAPPEGPNGSNPGYDMFVTQRSHVVQQAIRQAAGDMRLMNPVSLVENHSACRTNRAGQRVLPNGQVWKPHLLLLSFASKILAEANALLKLQDTPPGKPFATRSRAPPLPFLLSSLLQSRPQVKLPEEQFSDDDEDLDETSDSDEDVDYDELPPFKRLTTNQIAMLSKDQRKAYFDELEYRERLLMKQQLKEERRRRRMMKKMAEAAKDLPRDYRVTAEEESGGAASVPVPMPDLALPVSFDSDNPTHRYRYLDSSTQWLIRPVLETHGWDHDVGYEGINVERLFVVKEKVPVSFSGQVTKDKKDANVQMELASSVKHGEGKATSLGFDMQTVGKELAYTLRSETRFSNFRRNKATAGVSVTLLGDALSAGMKIEDKFIPHKRLQVVMTGGAMSARGDIAYGGSLEAQLKDKDHPLGRSLSTLGLSVMDWHGDLAVGCNIQSQIPIGRSTNLIARANLNNRGAGQVSLRINSSEQLQLALVALIPLVKKLLGYHQTQFGQ